MTELTPIDWAKRFAGPGEKRWATGSRGVTTFVARRASGLNVGPVSARARKPYASTGRSQPCWNATVATESTQTTPATIRAEVSLTGFGNAKRDRIVRSRYPR